MCVSEDEQIGEIVFSGVSFAKDNAFFISY